MTQPARTWAQLGEQETIWAVVDAFARVDRALRSAAVVVRGLEESLQASSDAEGAVARRRAGHAVWADVREVGDRTDRGQFATSERASGAAARDASGPAGEEAAAEADLPVTKGRMCIWTENICRSTTSGLRAWRPRRRTITGERQRQAELDRIFRLESERTIGERRGGAVPGPIFTNGKGRAGSMRRHRARCWCAKGGMERSRIEYRGREMRFQEIAAPASAETDREKRREASELQRKAVAASVRRKAVREYHPWQASGARGRPSGKALKSRRWRSGRRGPGPALRPKRCALRAPQGCAPAQAHDGEKPGTRNQQSKSKGDTSNEVS